MPKVESRAAETRQRELSELEAQRPELAAWLRPLRVALAAASADPWRSLQPLTATTHALVAPLLHDATLPIDEPAGRALVRAVLTAAFGESARPQLERMDALQLIERAIAQDDAGMAELAAGAHLDARALAASAQLAALPVLMACARSLAPQTIRDRVHGYCPVCGAHPVLAEVLGLERSRQLRCGRCGTGWRTHVLLCAFCGERDHAQLGSLVPDGRTGQICWVETCNSCKGYLKARAALCAATPENVLIEDARTLELDFVAVDRGYQKPAAAGFATRVRLARMAPGVS